MATLCQRRSNMNEKNKKSIQDSMDFYRDFFRPLEEIIQRKGETLEEGHWMISEQTGVTPPVEGG